MGKVFDGRPTLVVLQFCVSAIPPQRFPPKNMNPNLAFRSSVLTQGLQVRHLAALALLCPSLLALSTASSQGAAATPDGATYTTKTLTYVAGVAKWVSKTDPAEVQAFQYTITFDAGRARFNTTAGVLSKIPFNVSFVDNTVGAAGSLVISGSTPIGQVKPGDVDLFEIVFDDLQPGQPINNVVFTVGGGANDFLKPYDPVLAVFLPNITGAANLQVSRAVTPGILPMGWDPDGTYNNGTMGGPGVWNTASTSFDAMPLPAVLNGGQAPADSAWTNGTNLAVFGGNPGSGLVTVSGNISVGGFQFDMPGYQLSGGTLTLTTPVGAVPTMEVRVGEVAINSPVDGTAGFVKNGVGTLTLGGNNAFTGAVKINAGTVQVSADQNLGTAPPVATPGMLVLAGGTLRVSSTMTLNSNRGVDLSGAGGTVDVALGGNLTYAGVIDGSGSLTKVGAGTLTLLGNSTFSGGMTIIAGTLVNNGSLAGNVAVLGGTQLSGGGSISGLVTIGPGGHLHPSVGGVPVTMNLGSVTLNSSAIFDFALNSNSALADKLIVSSGTDLGTGTAQLSVQDFGFTPLLPGTAFTIIDNVSGPMSGFFNGLPEGASVTAGANTFRINYSAGSGANDVLLTVVPEPASALLLTAALALGSARRLRPRRP